MGEETDGDSSALSGPPVVINQVYAGTGASDSSFNANYVELFNRSTDGVDLGGMFVQWADGASKFAEDHIVALPQKQLRAGGHLLVQIGPNARVGTALSADVKATTAPVIVPTSGKVVLTKSKVSACGTSATPCPTDAIVDVVGYGKSTLSAGAPLAALGPRTAAVRNGAGCGDGFSVDDPNPQNAAVRAGACAVNTSGENDAGDGGDAKSEAGDAGATDAAPADASDGAAPKPPAPPPGPLAPAPETPAPAADEPAAPPPAAAPPAASSGGGIKSADSVCDMAPGGNTAPGGVSLALGIGLALAAVSRRPR